MIRHLLAQLVIALVAFVVAAPAIPEAHARPGKVRPARAKRAARTTKGAGAKQKKKLRADQGQVSPDRSPLRAKVSTGERPRAPIKPGRRVDPSSLPLDEQVAQQIEELLKGPLRDGTTSLFVADADTGKPLFSVYPDDPLNPASNVKLIASATALDILGPDFRYVTRVLGETPDDAGVIHNDLYLLGTYDPTLSRKGVENLAEQLVASGTRRIEGDIVVGSTSTRDGMYRSFVELTVTAGPPGQPPQVTMTPPTDFVQIDIQALTSKKKRVRAGVSIQTTWVVDEQQRKRLKVTVGGQIAAGRTVRRDVWTKERAFFAAHLLRQALRDAGVEVLGDVHMHELRGYLDVSLAKGFIPVPLAEHRSQRLAEILQRVNKRSTNWLADRVIMTAAARKYGGKPSMDLAIDAMYAWLGKRTELGRDDLVVDSGSGLSYRTELSARQVVTILRAGLGFGDADEARNQRLASIRDAYRASLSIGGKDGTLRKRFKKTSATVLGKTGTLLRVVSLAGVVEVAPDRRLVFSIITNGHRPHWKGRIRDAHERLVLILCNYLDRLAPPAEAIASETAPAAATTTATAPTAADADDDLEILEDADETDEAGVTETTDVASPAP